MHFIFLKILWFYLVVELFLFSHLELLFCQRFLFVIDTMQVLDFRVDSVLVAWCAGHDRIMASHTYQINIKRLWCDRQTIRKTKLTTWNPRANKSTKSITWIKMKTVFNELQQKKCKLFYVSLTHIVLIKQRKQLQCSRLNGARKMKMNTGKMIKQKAINSFHGKLLKLCPFSVFFS